jgi:hypothetical protein
MLDVQCVVNGVAAPQLLGDYRARCLALGGWVVSSPVPTAVVGSWM